MAVQCSEVDEVIQKFGDLNVNTTETYNNELSVQNYSEIDLCRQDEDGDTVLHVIILCLFGETALTIIQLVEDIDYLNIRNNFLQTPLHLAVLTGQSDIARALVKKGADVTMADRRGDTALHIACRKGDQVVVSLLVLSFKNDIFSRVKYFDMKNNEGLTCMHIAAQKQKFIILGHLFAKGADVNIGDAKSGRTLLHFAVENNQIQTVSILLTHPGIDVNCRTFKGETPLVIAYWRNYKDFVRKLLAKGALFNYDLVEDPSFYNQI